MLAIRKWVFVFSNNYISKHYNPIIKNSKTDEAKQKNATFAGLFFEI